MSDIDEKDRKARKALRWLRRRREVEAIRKILADDQSTHALNTSALAERLYGVGLRPALGRAREHVRRAEELEAPVTAAAVGGAL